MVVLLSARHLRMKPINRFIIHQSVIDTIACVITILQEVLAQINGAVQPVICHLLLNKMSAIIMLYISTYNMTCMTIERHLAITKPLQYDVDKVRKRLPFVFLLTWLFSITVLLFVPITTAMREGVCITGYYMRDINYYYGPHCIVIAIVIPLAIMIVCYVRMYLALRYVYCVHAVSRQFMPQK